MSQPVCGHLPGCDCSAAPSGSAWVAPLTKSDRMVNDLIKPCKKNTVFHQLKDGICPLLIVSGTIGLIVLMFYINSHQYPTNYNNCRDDCGMQFAEGLLTEESGYKGSEQNGKPLESVHVLAGMLQQTRSYINLIAFWCSSDRLKLLTKMLKENVSTAVKVRHVLVVSPDHERQVLEPGLHTERIVLADHVLRDEDEFPSFAIDLDGKHFFLDWGEGLGLLAQNCSCLCSELERIFTVYWRVGDPEHAFRTIRWPSELDALYTIGRPLLLDVNGQPLQAFFSSTPAKAGCPSPSSDLDAVLAVMMNATDFIDINIHSYKPVIYNGSSNTYWSVMENALRTVCLTPDITIRLLVQGPLENRFLPYLQSLHTFTPSIQVKVVQSEKVEDLPMLANYVVTDRMFYIGKRDWTGNSFMYTPSIGFVAHLVNSSSDLRHVLEDTFLSYWTSPQVHWLRKNDAQLGDE